MFTVDGDDRPDVQDILIIFADGKASDKWTRKPAKIAQKLKDRNVRIITILSGRYREKIVKEYEKIASSPSDVFVVDFDHLHDTMVEIVDEYCTETPAPPCEYNDHLD